MKSSKDILEVTGDRDQIIMAHIRDHDKLEHASSHMGPIDRNNSLEYVNPESSWADTGKLKIALVMAPSWGILFPPYNIAKLTGSLRHFNYNVKVYDVNIESYHYVLNKTNENLWQTDKYFLWTNKENFNDIVLPKVKPLFDKVIDEIATLNPDVVAFSVYSTNFFTVKYMSDCLKERLPDKCFIGGGPEITTGINNLHKLKTLPFNYFFVGEAERNVINFLEDFPVSFSMHEVIGTTTSRLSLQDLPFPDYSDYKLSNYLHPDGVSIETSRGCVAQCSFCAETYFWKFRSNDPEKTVQEIEHQITKYNVKRFWFVDSLVNGNLKSFERILDLLIEKKLKIKWNSYARCDGRMTKDFIKKIADSGCTCLSYGVESGSQKVLHDMRKKIEVWEIENNLNDGKEVGLFNHVNWIIGFPTEEPIDFFHSLLLIFNTRSSIGAISPGFGAGPTTGSHLTTDWKLYGIEGQNHIWDTTFLGRWFTKNYNNTIIHRFLRIKLFNIWLEIISKLPGSSIKNGQRFVNVDSFYKFKTNNSPTLSKLTYNEFVDFTTKEGDSLSYSLVSEYKSLCYALYCVFGSFELEVYCDPHIDLDTFGSFVACDYDSTFKFIVDEGGLYLLDIEHNFIHQTFAKDIKEIVRRERLIEDKSFQLSYRDSGNVNNWISDIKQTKETVHEQYRKKHI